MGSNGTSDWWAQRGIDATPPSGRSVLRRLKVLEAPSHPPWLGDNRTDTPLTLTAGAAAAIDSQYAFQSSQPVQ